MLRQYLSDRSGSTTLVFALSIPLFLGGIVMAVEVGHWQQNKSRLQNIADNAAIAAAREVRVLSDDADAQTTAEGDAFENGLNFSKGTLVAHNPPISGKYVGRDGVEVVIEQNQDLYFSRYFLKRQVRHEVRATALVLEGIPACVLSLSPTAAPGIKISGSSDIDITGCSAHSNSYASGAMEMSGSSSFTADCASAIGTILGADQMNLTQCLGAEEYALQMDDPYADVSVPADVNAMPCEKASGPKKGVMSLVPGRYCKSISTNGEIALATGGTYIFDNAELALQSGSAKLTGTNVTLIFMNGGTFKNINGGLVNISAKTTGEYAGIAMYMDRDTTPIGTNLTINGNQNSTVEGVYYFPTVDLKINGSSTSTSDCTHIIAYTVEFTGDAFLANTNCEGVGTSEIGGASGVALFE